MHKKGGLGVGIGTTSVLMLFIVLCLTTFGVLALITVDSDLKLTQRTTESILSFYEADSQAEEWLASVDNELILARNELEAIEHSRKLGTKDFSSKDLNSKEQEAVYKVLIKKRLEKKDGSIFSIDDGGKLQISYQLLIDKRKHLAIKVQIHEYKANDDNRYSILEWAVIPGEDHEYKELGFKEIKIGY